MKHVSFLISILITMTACSSYQFGNARRAMPGGYDRVSVPMFINKTHEVGIESYFTESLRTEFERSKIAKITPKNDAQVILEGVVMSVSFTPGLPVSAQSRETEQPAIVAPDTKDSRGRSNPLPVNTILSKEYSTVVTVKVVAKKVSDNSILWEGTFNGQGAYLGPLIGTPGLNASDAIYNQNSRQSTVSRIAKDMMSEAHDRLTENF
ncbi:MAG: LPS assembly lipoprotein LptE [Oligoflexia bacterium]|nr:LPS assembly lipoprotein LptE [Oligoflexia bacterium]